MNYLCSKKYRKVLQVKRRLINTKFNRSSRKFITRIFTSKAFNEQMDVLSKGIDKVFKHISIDDSSDKSTLEYVTYKLEKPSLMY